MCSSDLIINILLTCARPDARPVLDGHVHRTQSDRKLRRLRSRSDSLSARLPFHQRQDLKTKASLCGGAPGGLLRKYHAGLDGCSRRARVRTRQRVQAPQPAWTPDDLFRLHSAANSRAASQRVTAQRPTRAPAAPGENGLGHYPQKRADSHRSLPASKAEGLERDND